MRITVVDKNDEVIGAKGRDDILPDDIIRVSSLWIENLEGEVLMAQRHFSKKRDPGRWGPAAVGTVEEGETYETNIYKEAEEEIGLSGYDFEIGPKVFSDGKHKFFVQWFRAIVDRPLDYFKIQDDEVEQLKWVSKTWLKNDLAENPNDYVENSVRAWPKAWLK